MSKSTSFSLNKVLLRIFTNTVLGLEDSIESLAAADTELRIELALAHNRVTEVNHTVLEVDSRVAELDATLTTLEDTVIQIDGRVSQMEVSGEYEYYLQKIEIYDYPAFKLYL